jgi:futalosine hydrolase
VIEQPPLALLCSVDLEARPLLRRLSGTVTGRAGGRPATRGSLGGTSVLIVVGGMGKTNTAQALTAVLESQPVTGVVGFGVGGAYPGAGLEIGELALATDEVYGDEGVAAPEGWLSCEGIGIPLMERDGERFFNHFPLDPARVARAASALRASGLEHRTGRFVTVSTCSGTTARGQELEERFGGLCETMESAAAAHVAALYGIPYLGVRGVSNAVEDRDPSRWQLVRAAEVAALAADAIAGAWREIETAP